VRPTVVQSSLAKRATVEFVATAVLLAAISGSGIMGERLASGNVAIALLANSIATGAILIALILAFGEVSGAHINPMVTLSNAARGSFPWSETPAYIAAQVIGAFSGIALANIYVWPSRSLRFPPRPDRLAFLDCRDCGDRRVNYSDRVLCPMAPCLDSVRGCCLRDSSILVLSINVFRQSSRDTCPLHDGYLLRYSALGRSRFPGFSIRRCCRSNGISRMAPT